MKDSDDLKRHARELLERYDEPGGDPCREERTLLPALLARIEALEAERCAPSLTAEDLRELQRALDAWRQAHDRPTGPISSFSSANVAVRLLDRLDTEGKLGRSGR